jgi:hypothetical protein
LYREVGIKSSFSLLFAKELKRPASWIVSSSGEAVGVEAVAERTGAAGVGRGTRDGADSDLSFALIEHEQAYIKAEILDELC